MTHPGPQSGRVRAREEKGGGGQVYSPITRLLLQPHPGPHRRGSILFDDAWHEAHVALERLRQRHEASSCREGGGGGEGMAEECVSWGGEEA